MAGPPSPPPFLPITFSNREGCKHKTKRKKGKGSWDNENQRKSNVYATLPFSLWGHFPF